MGNIVICDVNGIGHENYKFQQFYFPHKIKKELAEIIVVYENESENFHVNRYKDGFKVFF